MTLTPGLCLPDDNHWVIDTDYDNYAVHYSCRLLDQDGSCLDSYSFIFSRHITGLRTEDQPKVTQKKAELCLLGKYRRVEHSGESGASGLAFRDRPRLGLHAPFSVSASQASARAAVNPFPPRNRLIEAPARGAAAPSLNFLRFNGTTADCFIDAKRKMPRVSPFPISDVPRLSFYISLWSHEASSYH